MLLDDIVALEGRMPAEELKGLLADLRNSWVLKRENIRLTTERSRAYDWRLPRVTTPLCRKRMMDWLAEKILPFGWRFISGFKDFVLAGNGPDHSSLLSYSTLQEIDRQLRLSTPAFNGFDGLCAHLRLPARRSNLRSSFQILVELPAAVFGVWLEKAAMSVEVFCRGLPDLMVEWLPCHELQRFQSEWIVEPPFLRGAVIAVPRSWQGARLILSFGELQANVSVVEAPFLESYNKLRRLHFVQEDPTVSDFATEEASNQEYGRRTPTDREKHSKPDPWVLKRRKIIEQHPEMSGEELCVEFDIAKIPLPPDPDWDLHRKKEYPWASAYDDPEFDHDLRQRIFQIIAHDIDRTKTKT